MVEFCVGFNPFAKRNHQGDTLFFDMIPCQESQFFSQLLLYKYSLLFFFSFNQIEGGLTLTFNKRLAQLFSLFKKIKNYFINWFID